MEKTIKKEYELINLSCANCALKIEKAIREIPEIKEAAINFSTGKLIIGVDKNSDFSTLIKKIEETAAKIEESIKVTETAKENTESKAAILSKQMIIIYIAAFVIYIFAIFATLNNIMHLILFLAVYLVFGLDVIIKAVKNFFKGKAFDENLLMSVATIGAFSIGDYREGVAVMIFYKIGELFQKAAVNRSRKSIKEIMKIRPDYANLKTGDEVKRVSPEEVKIGDIIIIKPGERIPLDGIVISGTSNIDTSSLTGESLPKAVFENEEVLSGSVNVDGVITVKVTKIFRDSTVSKILTLIENSHEKKAKSEQFITKFAAIYTPIVVFSALFLAVIPPILLGQSFSIWIYRALLFLVISCPCALVLSVPLGIFGGIGGASKHGILIKGGEFIDALNSANTVVFDKTGTLTKGSFSVSAIHPVNGFTEEKVLETAAFAGSHSSHPISLAVIKAYQKNIDINKIISYKEIAGKGVYAEFDGKKVFSGNRELMVENNIEIPEDFECKGQIFVAADGKLTGCIEFSDELKEDAKKAIDDLKKEGIISIYMLTGDNESAAKAVSEKLNIDYFASLLPYQKVEKFEEIKAKNSGKGTVIFVGDGINDAPVLAQADAGIAMGGIGTDSAVEASDVVILTDEPSKVAKAIEIARFTKRRVVENIVLTLSVKGVVLLLGALGFATMWEAVFADVGIALIAVLNSIRTLRVK